MEVRLCTKRRKVAVTCNGVWAVTQRLSEELGRCHGWGWKEWYGEPKPKVQ